MNKLKIREIIDQVVDFFKLHYEYLLPFSLLYILLNLPSTFISSVWILPLSILIIPLGFSMSYFTDRLVKGAEKKFGLFFEVYQYFFKYLGIVILKGIIILILLSPFLYTIMDVFTTYNYDMQKFNEAIQLQAVHFSSQSKIMMAVSILLVLFSLPFMLFNEYYAILDNNGILESFVKGYTAGAQYYISIFVIVMISVIVLFLGMISCGIGLVFALPFMYLLYYFTYRAIEPISKS